jgi:hypothetical protein
MKTTSIACGLLGLALAAPAYSQTVIDVTGATAFRSAAIAAIRSKFTGNYQYAHDAAAAGVSGANKAIFKGTFTGITGTTYIRCSWNGSVEGVRALVDPDYNPSYYTTASGNIVTAASSSGGETHKDTVGFAKTTETSQSDIAFSDVSKDVTPYAADTLSPATPECGVVVFTMVTNEGSTITNVTAQQFRALFTKGNQPLSLFTGVATDTSKVYAFGRNDGSGTRTTYLVETGYGVTKAVNQFVVKTSDSSAITAIQKIPAGGVGGGINDTTLASSVWGINQAGNGGYSSGSSLRTDMAKTGASVTAYEADGTTAIQSSAKADLVTFLSISDAASARGNGAVICGYNGVKLEGIAASGSSLSAADTAKVTNGAYTAWGYQQMYCRNSAYSGNIKKAYDNIKSGLTSANIGSAGLQSSLMNVSRSEDGGTVAP